MKKQFTVALLYGMCIVLVMTLIQYTDIENLLGQDERTHPNVDIHNLFDKTIAARDHQLPFKVEEGLYSALNRSLKRLVKRPDQGEVLTDLLPANWSSSSVIQPWQRFINNIRRHVFYSEDDPLIDEVIHRMKSLRITEIIEKSRTGTEFKFFFTLADGTPIIAKPMRLMINNEPPPNMSKNDFYERFQSEVAAYHLSSATLVALIVRPIHLSTDGATCFTGHCPKKCDEEHPTCGQPDVIPASFALLLPKLITNGWVPNPTHGMTARRSGDSNVCDSLEKRISRRSSATRSYLDIVDINVFDFIQGNLDRHHYGQIIQFGNNSYPVLFDNGRGFARSYQDEFDLLYPMYKCCKIRQSTFEKLINVYQKEGGLREAMRRSLKSELVHPLLTEDQLFALDRRLVKVLEAIYGCIGTNIEGVIINDGY
ncbi:hypothetical protein LSH36_68g07014 [Paralvinella palmiformis]|uniref:FAM20 C-terminal domain-containing protein n=1 Tax=Paralvinella palmiformis TaxID=53620 RepID=A0AAD9K552_9ANNE|nr:hypothetical protein LSH36_68g07014 [Paralvinella palmiformis]